jgi:hypothetical protein
VITDEEYENPWTYRGSRFSLPDEELQKLTGFVYLIQRVAGENRYYIGQKLFHSSRVKLVKNPKTGLKKRTRVKVESDWKTYYGSSEELKADVERLGPECFTREILHLCTRKGNMNYMELFEQVRRRVLFRDDYYNGFVGGKIHAKHLTEEADIAW